MDIGTLRNDPLHATGNRFDRFLNATLPHLAAVESMEAKIVRVKLKRDRVLAVRDATHFAGHFDGVK